MGFINKESLDKSLASNFGDIGSMKYPKIEKDILLNDIKKALELSETEKEELKNIIFNETNLHNIVDRIEKKYFELYVDKTKYEVPVIMYHRVINNSEDEGVHGTYIYENIFREHMQYLKDKNYTVITFKDLDKISWRNRFEKDKKYIILTFDDGYKDNLKNALPILKKYNMKMVLFLITSETYNKWDTDVENREKEKKFNLMTKEEVKELIASDLVEIGGHTTKHLDMPNVDLKTIEEDLNISNKIIEEITGYKPISFAYPWGRSTKESRDIVKKVGYKFAVSTEDGPACFSDDLFEIVRVGIYSDDDIEKFKLRISGKYPFIREKRNEMKAFRNKIRKFFGIKIKQ